jgi:hypothetical protein
MKEKTNKDKRGNSAKKEKEEIKICICPILSFQS